MKLRLKDIKVGDKLTLKKDIYLVTSKCNGIVGFDGKYYDINTLNHYGYQLLKKSKTKKKCKCTCHLAPGLFDVTGMKTECRHCKNKKTISKSDISRKFAQSLRALSSLGDIPYMNDMELNLVINNFEHFAFPKKIKRVLRLSKHK